MLANSFNFFRITRPAILRYLRRYRLFYSVKYHPWVQILLKRKNKQSEAILLAELKLYQQIFPGSADGLLVFDIGANVGDVTGILTKLATHILAVEPEPANFKCLQARYSHHPQITLLRTAVGATEGFGHLYQEKYGTTLHTLSQKWQTYLTSDANDRWKKSIQFDKGEQVRITTLDKLIKRYGSPYFIKIDAEGYEKEIISGLSTRIPWLAFEVNLPQFLAESIASIEHLTELDPNTRFNYAISTGQMALQDFVSSQKMKAILETTHLRHLDIFCRTA